MNENKYLISIVTPFHNTDISLFKKGFTSLKKQTLGFEKIEWVVVIHNSEKHYFDDVQDVVKGCENVKVFELHNDVRSPSSPRNYALDHCTGKYIAFMDSDDRFNLTALKEISDVLESTNAQMATFRAEKEMEDDKIMEILDVRVPFDQTKSLIELHRGDPEINFLIHESSLTVWTKMIRRDFIEAHHIRFDDKIPMGEDCMFNIICYKYIEHIAILPQTIGYVYYMNHGSIVQSPNRSVEAVVAAAEGFAIWFDAILDGGYELERIGWPCIALVSDMMLMNPDMPEDDKIRIREKMKPYVLKMNPLNVEEKFFTKEQAESLMAKVRSVIMQEESDSSTKKTDEAQLLEILRRNASCELGRKYGFAKITSAKEYSEEVPVTDYSNYGPLIELSTRIGETNIYTADKVIGYFGELGSMQNPQKYPVTSADYEIYKGILESQINETPESTFLVMSSLPKEKATHYKDNTYLDSIYGAAVKAFKSDDIFTSYRRNFKYGCITSPEMLVYPSEQFDLRYGRLLFALADADVSQIVASNTWALLDLFRFLEKYWKNLTDDLENGTVSIESGLNEELRTTLGAKLDKMPERARELRAIFAEGFDVPVIPKIWKNIQRIIANGFGDFAFYTERLRRYSGEISIDDGYYFLPSGVIAKASGNDEILLHLLRNNLFMELLPVNTDGTAIGIDNAENGKCYEIIVTNNSGIYRCRTGIVVKAVKPDENTLTFVYVCRHDELITIDGVQLNTILIGSVVNAVQNETGIAFDDYSTAEGDNGELVIYLDPANDESYEKANSVGSAKLTEMVNNHLKEIPELIFSGNPEKLPVAEVRIVQPETQLLLRDRRMMDLNSSTDQMRPIRVLDNPKYKALYNSMS